MQSLLIELVMIQDGFCYLLLLFVMVLATLRGSILALQLFPIGPLT